MNLRPYILAGLLTAAACEMKPTCEYIVDDTLGAELPIRGGPKARETDGTGVRCWWAL